MLEGTIAKPEKDTEAAFVIISGSGKGDLDGNFKSFKLNIYKGISAILVSEGFTTLRYNKRGIGKSEGNFYVTGLHDLLDDLDSAVSYLKSLNYKMIYLNKKLKY